MDSVIKKFIECLLNIKKQVKMIQKESVDAFDFGKVNRASTYLDDIDNLVRILRVDKKEWGMRRELFYDFDILSEFLIATDMNAKECKYIILTFIIKNIATGLLDGLPMVVDAKKLEGYSFKSISDLEKYELINGRGIYNLLNDNASFEKKSEFLEFAQKYCTDISWLVDAHRIIQMHYLDKITNYNIDDIDEVMGALKSLGVSLEVCNKIEIVLKKVYFKRKRLEKQKVEFSFAKTNYHSAVKLLSDKEYKSIKKELNSYYDFYNNYLIRELSFDEIIYCVSLMLKLGEDKKRIYEFLVKVSNSWKKEESLYVYEKELERLKFYQDKYELSDGIINLEQCLFELERVRDSSLDEYCFWKELLVEEIAKTSDLINENYEYEIHLARKLLKREDG